MPADTTTFFLSFATVFGGIAWMLLHMERRARRLEERLRDVEASTNPKNAPPPGKP